MARELPGKAREILESRGVEATAWWGEKWHDEHGRAFVVAQMQKEEQLRWVHQALVKSMKRGTTKREFVKTLGERLAKAGWQPTPEGGSVPFRLKRIYDINRRVSRAAGQWERIQRTKRLLPYLLYGLGPSENHREAHARLAGKCLHADDEFWDTHYPPNGWGCKCWVRQVTRAERDRRVKKKKEDGERPKIEWETKGVKDPSGKIWQVKVPRGVDPGWAYNPGAAPWEGVGRGAQVTANRLLVEQGEASAKRFVNDLVREEGFEAFATRPMSLVPPVAKKSAAQWQSSLPVAVLSEGQAKGASRLLVMKQGTAAKQLESRAGAIAKGKFGVTDYANIQGVLDGVVMISEGERNVGWGTAGGKNYILVWENENGRNILVTFYSLSSDPANMERTLKRIRKTR